MKKRIKVCYAILMIIVFFMLLSCLTEVPFKISFQSLTPQNLGDGWEIADPTSVGMDTEALNDVYKYVHDENNVWQIRSLLVFRNNRLIAESYMKDLNDRTNLHPIWSCTKQVIGLLTGIAIDNSLITLNDTISDIFPQKAARFPNKSDITIENLLMMKSGINFSNDGYNGESSKLGRGNPSNSLDLILGLGKHAHSGTSYKYKDGDPHLLSAVIHEKTGEPTGDWAKKVFFNKIGVTRLEWRTHKDGITFGGFGILTTPREMGKIGQLVANNGSWNGQQIISTNWINEMTSVKVPPSEVTFSGLAFGYQWWAEIERNISIAAGHGGQFILVNREKNLVVVITSERHPEGSNGLSAYSALSIFDRIGNAIME